MNALQPTETLAVLTLSETGEIVAARDACMAVFGREVGALIGINVRVLLKGGLDNDVGRLLHGYRTGKDPTEAAPLHVAAIRKDGTEFMACATTRTWNLGTALTKKSDATRLTWTIEFRDLAAPGDKTGEESSVQPLKSEVPDAGRAPGSAQEATIVSSVGEGSPGNSKNEDGLTGEMEVASEQQPIAESQQNVQDSEGPLRKIVEEFAAFKTEASRQAENQQKLECELRAQLDAAKESAGRAEAALKEETERKERLEERLQTLSSSLKLEQAERSKRFEQELISLRQERDELDRKLAAEQQAGTESTTRASDLEKRLAKNAADFERAKAELEQQNDERQRVETAWREQLDTAFIAKKQMEGAWAGEVERSKRMEEELLQLRQEHDELAAKLAGEQQAACESRQRAKDVEGRLGRNAVESERARAELEKEAAERERIEAVWRGQLAEANARKEKSELALNEATRANKRLEQEFARVQTERDELNGRLHAEQRAAAESVRRLEALQRTASQSSAELERIRGVHGKLEKALAETTERDLRLESDREGLQRKCDELATRLAAHQTTTDKSKGRAQELKSLLEQRTAELERVQAELNEQIGNRDRLESEWRKQLDQVKSQAKELESAWTGAVDRNMHFEEMLSSLRAERDDLIRKLKAEKQSAAQTKQQFDEFQGQRRLEDAEIMSLKAELEKRSIEQARTEAELNKRLETATSLTKKLETAWTEAVQRNQRLESELVVLRRRHDEPTPGGKTEAASEKPAAAPQVKASRIVSERERSKTAPEKALRIERNSIEPGGKSAPSSPGEKSNGHHAPAGRKPVNADLRNPPLPGVGLYNLNLKP